MGNRGDVTAIVGKNSSGKTVILRRNLENALREGKICTSNMIRSERIKMIVNQLKLDQKLVEFVNQFMDGVDLEIIDGNKINLKITGDFEIDDKNEALESIINIVFKECDCIYLDEPEQLLSDQHIIFLCKCLNYIKQYRYIEYVTHSRTMLACIADNEYEVYKENKEFKIREVDERKIYEYTI